MSNVNNWQFAKQLDTFKTKVIDPQSKKVDEAEKIMSDDKYQWASEEAKKTAQAKYDYLRAWLQYYLVFYKEGLALITQHENIVNNIAKWYAKWYNDVSNEGRQETEIMGSQADMIQEIFSEMFKEIQSLKLEGVTAPKALNLK